MKVYGLIGNPVGHSLSPPMQEAGFDAIGLDARYVTFEPPKEAAGEAIRAAELLGLDGLNVTIPFKRDALELVEPDKPARRIGAVNTIVFGSDGPSGHNTDLEGAIRAFEHHGVTLEGANAVVVGAGGAGRAIAFGLVDRGASVSIANRTASRAKALADELGGGRGHPLDVLPALLENADILVNATSVGMNSDESVVPATALHDDLTVMDAVYRPLETRLLRDAAAAGAQTIDGAWMLLYQGIGSFERWTGADAPIEEMNRALRAQLATVAEPSSPTGQGGDV